MTRMGEILKTIIEATGAKNFMECECSICKNYQEKIAQVEAELHRAIRECLKEKPIAISPQTREDWAKMPPEEQVVHLMKYLAQNQYNEVVQQIRRSIGELFKESK